MDGRGLGTRLGIAKLKKRRLSGTNLSSENNLPTLQLDAPVIIRAKVKDECCCLNKVSKEASGIQQEYVSPLIGPYLQDK